MSMEYVGPYQIPRITAGENVARVVDSHALAAAINNGLSQAESAAKALIYDGLELNEFNLVQAVEVKDAALDAAGRAEYWAGIAQAPTQHYPLIVHHGSNADAERPNHPGPVVWTGQAIPHNRQPGDFYFLVAVAGSDALVAELDLVAWHDCSTLDGASVTGIADISGNGHHLNLIGGSGDITVGSQNGRSTALIPRSQFLTSQSYTLSLSRPYHVFMVVRVPRNAATQTFFDGGADARHGLFVRGSSFSTDPNAWGVTTGVSGTSNTAASEGFNVLATRRAVDPGDPATDVFQLFVNGAEVPGAVSYGTSSAALPGSHMVGASWTGGGLAELELAELIIARTVTPQQQAEVEEYLKDKWGV